MTDRDERADRYRAGLCVTCGLRPHSAGRPRCTQCHQDWIAAGCPGDICPGCKSTSPERIHFAHCPTIGAR